MEYKTQEEYLLALAEAIKYLNPKDATKVLQYYQTRITNAIEYGEKEEDVIRRLPDIDTVAKETYESHGVNYLEMRKKQLKRKQIINNITGVIISIILLAVFFVVMFLVSQTIINMFTLLVKTFQSGKGIDKIITPLAIILYILCALLLTVYLVDLFIIMIFNFIGPVIKMKDESKHRKIFTFTITGLIEDKTNHQKVQAKLIVSFIVLFLICLGVSYSQKGYFKNSLDNIPSNTSTYTIEEPLTDINISGFNGNIYFKLSDDNKIYIEHQYEFKHEFNVTPKDNKLNIELELTKAYDILNLLTEPTQNVIIYLPSNNDIENINVIIDNGIVDFQNIENNNIKATVKIESKGTLSASKTALNSLTLEGNNIAFGVAEADITTLNVTTNSGQTLIQQNSNINNLIINNGVGHVRLENSNIDNVTITNGSGPVYCENLTGTSFDLTTKASTNDLVKTMYKKYNFNTTNAGILTLSQVICTGNPVDEATKDEIIKVNGTSSTISFKYVKGSITILGEKNFIYLEGIGNNIVCENLEEGKEKCDNQNCEICTTDNTNFYNNVTNVSSSVICENSGKTSKTEVVNAKLTSASFTQNQGFFIYKNSNVIESVVNCSGCMTVDLVDLAGTTCNLYLSKIETSVIIDAEVNTGINYILKNTDTISFAKIFRNEETINFTYEESE